MAFRSIEDKFWTDEKVKQWDVLTRYLALYLLTCPHCNMLGYYVIPKGYMLTDLKLTEEQLAQPFAKLLEDGFIEYDETVEIVFIKQFLKYNSIQNPNQVKAAIKLVQNFPQSYLISNLINAVEQLQKPFLEPLLTVLKPLRNPFETLSKPFQNPMANQKQEQEQKQKQEQEEREYKEKEISTSQTSIAKPPSKSREEKIKYAEFVAMTEKEYQSLVERLGSEERVRRGIEILNAYKGAHGRRYRSDYLAFLSWVEERLKEEEMKNQEHVPRGIAGLREFMEEAEKEEGNGN